MLFVSLKAGDNVHYQNDKTMQHLIQEEFSIYINLAFIFSLFDHKHFYIHNFLKHLSLDWLYENEKKCICN